jgi:hypothetical protein
MCFLFHKWSVWSVPYVVERTRAYGSFGNRGPEEMTIQKRECLQCGKIETRLVNDGK